MADAIILIAALPALFAAGCGDRAGLVLCINLAICYALAWFGADFSPLVWAVPDLIVAIALVRIGMPLRNVAIVGLIVPMWAAYFLPDTWRYLLTSAIVVVQFILTIPAIKPRVIFDRLRKVKRGCRDFDLRDAVKV